MFKGIKKRFGSNRSSKNRRWGGGTGGRDQRDSGAPRESSDKGNISSKPTSPRQVHPANQISPLPYAGRSLERRSRTVPTGKAAPSYHSNGAYDRRTDSFCLPPKIEATAPAPAPVVYPTAFNICVTGGKIEFVTPSDSSSSTTIVTSQVDVTDSTTTTTTMTTFQPNCSPKKMASPLRLQNNAVVTSKSPQKLVKSPLKQSKKKNSPSEPPLVSGKTRHVSPSSKIPLRNASPSVNANEIYISNSDLNKNTGSLELKQSKIKSCVRRSSTMPDYEDVESELEFLRVENKQFKNKLATLELEYLKVRKKQNSKLCAIDKLQEDNCGNVIIKNNDKENYDSQYNDLAEKCRTLELANTQLQADSHIQRQQYEKCLDQVASQVVQAILVQKTQQEECDILSKRVEELQIENSTLSSFITVNSGHIDQFNLPPHQRAHLLPLSNSQSLPGTLTKPKENSGCDNRIPEIKEASSIWYNEPQSNLRVATSTSKSRLPSSSSSSLPPRNASMKSNSLRPPTSADRCWYDIIKSFQSGENHHIPSTNDAHNISSDSSSFVDQEDSNFGLVKTRRVLSGIEDASSTSSAEDFKNTFQQNDSNPSTFPSCPEALSPSGTDSSCTLVASSHSSDVQRNSCEFPSLCLNLESQGSVRQNLVVNFSLSTTVPEPSQISASDPLIGTKETIPPGDKMVAVTTTSENAIKDEGYSTMSSDVQSEVKDSGNVCTISTVEEEEKVKNVDHETKDSSPTGTLKSHSIVRDEKGEKLKCHSMSEHDLLPVKDKDGLRIIYDHEDDNSDIIFVPIADDKDHYLRHSFNFPFPDEPYKLERCYSDSYLCKLCVRYPSFHPEERVYKLNELHINSAPVTKNMSLNSKSQRNHYQTYLRRAFRKESFKRACYRYLSKSSFQGLKEECLKSGGRNFDTLCHIFPPSVSHPRILSPSYSHAEMEDWSLDLSGEDITTPGTEPSRTDSVTVPSHHQSQPSIQETALDLEEDHHDFLWNGATYLKMVDNELSWPYNKEQGKGAWEMNILGNKPSSHSMISPKSGSSDQPAMWSSSEQLSCCSDIASKCSTDIENFCDQLCNLPELKRISIGSSDNGRSESATSNPKLSEIDSIEDCSEVLEDLNIDTVFTRDFYRLVKFESTKSLSASSKSLAYSEGFLTLEKLKDLESLQDSKTLASVLGFIAEQQKYCKYRERLDETSFSSAVRKDKTRSLNSEQSDSFSENKTASDRRNSSVCESDSNLTSSDSISCLESELMKKVDVINNRFSQPMPPKPKRSTSLNLGRKSSYEPRPRGTLPSCTNPPIVPLRSKSGLTLPYRNTSASFSRDQHIKEDDCFPPPPPPEDPYTEPYHSIPLELAPPTVPVHRTPILPRRSSSMIPNPTSCDSPPIPKRITSRALPVLPHNAPVRTSSLENSSSSSSLLENNNRTNRPRSLLKEATLGNALNKAQRISCGDLGPLCRNSASLMLELEKMAKAEEDDDDMNTAGSCSPEVASPGTEVGLGTGWVRVQPTDSLRDPQTRANLLDTMMPSSEGCSSETDEDLAKQLQHKELLKAVQRNRRKKKALHHNDDPTKLSNWHPARPTILGRPSLFNRFGEAEEKALQEFRFLESFPSQTDLRSLEKRTDVDLYAASFSSSSTAATHHYAVPRTDLKNLRSSEPFYPASSGGGYPLSSIPSPMQQRQKTELVSPYHVSPPLCSVVPPVEEWCETNPCYQSTEFNEYCPQSPLLMDGRHSRSLSPPESVTTPKTTQSSSPPVVQVRDTFSSFQKHVTHHSASSSCSSRKSPSYVSPYQCVPLIRPYETSRHQSVDKLLPTVVSDATTAKLNAALPSSSASPTKVVCVDTSSLGNVKSVVQRLNSRNRSPEITANKKKSPPARLEKTKASDMPGRSTHTRPPPPPPHGSNKPSVTAASTKLAQTSTTSNHRLVSPSFSSHHNEGISSSCASSGNAPPKKSSPNIPGGTNLMKRFAATHNNNNSPPASISVKVSPVPSIKGGVGRSSKLPKFKFGRNRWRKKEDDPLESFTGKSLFDSGSSESSSDKVVGGRLSISDSCAEVFSPGESGDEVFRRFF